MIDNFLTIKEVSAKWQISPRRVQILCSEGRVPGAVRRGRLWLIPAGCDKPGDNRIKGEGSESLQYFSELRKSSFNYLDLVSGELRSDIVQILANAQLAGKYPDDKALVKECNYQVLSLASKMTDSLIQFESIINYDRANRFCDEYVISVEKSLSTFEKFVKLNFDNLNRKLNFNVDVKAQYLYANIDLHFSLYRSLIADFCRCSSADANIYFDIVEVPSKDPSVCKVRYKISSDDIVKELSERQKYISSIYIFHTISVLNRHSGIHIDDFVLSKESNSYSFEIEYRIADASEFTGNGDYHWNELSIEDFGDDFDIRILLINSDYDCYRNGIDNHVHPGMEFLAFKTSDEALSCLDEKDEDYFDVIMINENSKEISVKDTISSIRNNANTRKANLPVIILSENPGVVREDLFISGADEFLFFPCESRFARHLIKNVIATKKSK